MTESPTPTVAPPRPRRALPWWLPGVALGLVAAFTTFFAAQFSLSIRGTHKAEGLVQLAAGEPETKRRQYAFGLRSPDLIARVLADPAVSSLDWVKGRQNPAGDIEARLTVAEVAPDVLSVTLTGNEPGDVKTILDHLVKQFVNDTSAFERRERHHQIKTWELYSDRLRTELEAAEAQFRLLKTANDGDDAGAQFARLQRWLTEADTALIAVGREMSKLEAELTVLKRQTEKGKDLPDPTRPARVTALTTALEIKREERAKLKDERDGLQRSLRSAVGGGLDTNALRQSLKPQQEQLEKVNAELFAARTAAQLDSRVSTRGEVTTAPVRTREERAVAVGVPVGIAFVAGFVLATGLGFTGLVFRALRRIAG